jgi:2-dehydropantoate 2-reductase
MSADRPSICIFGAGAIGGFLAARLAAAGADVSVVARGPHLAAIETNGLILESGGERLVTRPRVAADPATLGPQDYLVITLKAHSLAAALPQMRPLIGPQTTIVAGINGLPWWYFYALDGQYRDRRIEAVDPGGAVWEGLPPAQTLGCIVYPAAEIAEPGVIRHTFGDRFSLGEPDGSQSARAARLSRTMIAAGLKAPVRTRIRDELWVKLWGNMAFNPISALTTATLDRIAGDPETRALSRSVMLEGQRVAEALGVRFAIDVDKRLEGGASVGRHKTSMLQDLELGRPLEIEALLGAVVEVAQWMDISTPLCKALLAMVRQRASVSRSEGHHA